MSRVFEDIRDLKGDICIPDLEKTLSDDAEVAGTQHVLRASSASLVFIRFVWLHSLAGTTRHLSDNRRSLQIGPNCLNESLEAKNRRNFRKAYNQG